VILAVLGTHERPFPRAVRMAHALRNPADEELHVQHGHTHRVAGIDARWQQWYGPQELDEAMLSASVVVVHGGSGCIYQALNLGLRPVVIPRLARYREHVDDHQLQLPARLAEAGRVVLWAPHQAPGDVRRIAERGRSRRLLATRGELREAVWDAAEELARRG
jgi:UDP-N-acetylglucosamine transferase subunit ALG13